MSENEVPPIDIVSCNQAQCPHLLTGNGWVDAKTNTRFYSRCGLKMCPHEQFYLRKGCPVPDGCPNLVLHMLTWDKKRWRCDDVCELLKRIEARINHKTELFNMRKKQIKRRIENPNLQEEKEPQIFFDDWVVEPIMKQVPGIVPEIQVPDKSKEGK